MRVLPHRFQPPLADRPVNSLSFVPVSRRVICYSSTPIFFFCPFPHFLPSRTTADPFPMFFLRCSSPRLPSCYFFPLFAVMPLAKCPFDTSPRASWSLSRSARCFFQSPRTWKRLDRVLSGEAPGPTSTHFRLIPPVIRHPRLDFTLSIAWRFNCFSLDSNCPFHRVRLLLLGHSPVSLRLRRVEPLLSPPACTSF